MTIIDALVRDVTRTARREIGATVREFYPEPAAEAGADFGRKLGLWLTVGVVVLGVGAAVITAFTED
ncbi:MAG: hypothetical protein M8860_05880 [marine benthic group bacterium]|nr:hypothetical protein [Gemmatimonadota bacterium]MCL7962364.1 hypothetical protein [Candidatus Carthagonibacter metallireducens]MCL7964576.1 hypothetical protein [Gemmatimonadota bacterium]MCL7968695.1 hypothetical protein [Gemmatimonadota bacterium]MCL7975541.1 hypothetical protein [Gemmatimonadota bacterium]